MNDQLPSRPAKTSTSTAVVALAPGARFATIQHRFLEDPDNPRGYLALALHLRELFQQRGEISSSEIYDNLESISDEHISYVLYPAANRLLESHAKTLIERRAHAEIQQDRTYMLLSKNAEEIGNTLNRVIEGGLSQVSTEIATMREAHKAEIKELREAHKAEIRELAHTQSFHRQVVVSALATVIVAACAVVLVFSPDITSVIRAFFR